MDLTNYWNKVKKTSSCWFWTGANSNGYGLWNNSGKLLSVHRLSYEQHVGEIAEGMEIDHLCKNRNCVNPEHLEAVTHLTNTERGSNYKHGKSENYMKKKFLLYIHNPLFREESKKSHLVNTLLDAHYNTKRLRLGDKTIIVNGKDPIRLEYTPPVEVPPCCKLKKPCRHWAFDGVDSKWTNTITGEVKEV